jgi:hypothetical protein
VDRVVAAIAASESGDVLGYLPEIQSDLRKEFYDENNDWAWAFEQALELKPNFFGNRRQC